MFNGGIMQDLISIIVPIYGVERYIKGCIDSIINQTYKNLEIILVDDGSLDNCPSIIDEYAKKDSRIKVIHKKNGGLSSARNEGLKIATGKYLGFVDGDDTIKPEMYEVLINLINKYNSDVAISSFEKVCIDDNDNIIFNNEEQKKLEEKVITKSETLKMMMLDGDVGNFVCTKLFKKELFDGITFPEGRVYEDAATTYKLIDKSNKIVFTNLRLYNYLYGRVGAITSSFTPKKILDSLESYHGQYSFLVNNYKDISDYVRVSWIKMFTSAMEKIMINNYFELLNNDSVLSKYESFKEAMNRVNKNILIEYLEPYRLVSCCLLNNDINIYKNTLNEILKIKGV